MDIYNSKCDTLQLAPGVKSNHDFYLDFNVGLKVEKMAGNLTVNPNPFFGELNIHFINEKTGRVQINLTTLANGGSLLLTDKVFPAGDCDFMWMATGNNTNLAPGLYILSIETEIGRQICKVIKIGF
jgi:hypothetical protein